MNANRIGGVHWSFWIIGVVALIWNVMGAMNFIMQMNVELLATYPEAARTLVEGRPLWATGGFAVAVFGGALGCIFLLFRKSVANYYFVASLLGVIVTMIHTFGMIGSAISVPIGVGAMMSFVVALFLIWYSKHAEKKSWIS